MKKNIAYIFCLLTLGFGLTQCAQDSVLKIPEPVSGGQVKVEFQEGRSFLNALDLANAAIVMDLTPTDREGGTLIQSITIFATYTDFSDDSTYAEVEVGTVADFNSPLTYTADFLAGLWGFSSVDLGGGDRFDFTVNVNMVDGRVFTPENSSDGICLEENSRGTCSFFTFVGCPTEVVAGSYTGTPAPCVNDPFGQDGNRQVDADVEVSQVGVVSFRFSNADLGYYVGFGFPLQPLTILDVCNDFNLASRAEASFSITVEAPSGYDPGTSTATIQWLDAPNAGIECVSEFTPN